MAWLLLGLILLITVVRGSSTVGADGSSPAQLNNWGIQPYNVLSVQAGTIIDFNWSGLTSHSVVQLTDSLTFTQCTIGEGTVLSPQSTAGDFQFSTAGLAVGTNLYFVCGVGDHCQSGMKVQIQIIAAPNPCSKAKSSSTCKKKPACKWNTKQKKCLAKPAKG